MIAPLREHVNTKRTCPFSPLVRFLFLSTARKFARCLCFYPFSLTKDAPQRVLVALLTHFFSLNSLRNLSASCANFFAFSSSPDCMYASTKSSQISAASCFPPLSLYNSYARPSNSHPLPISSVFRDRKPRFQIVAANSPLYFSGFLSPMHANNTPLLCRID